MSVDVLVFVVQGLVLVGAAVVLTAQHQQAIGHGIGRVAKRSLSVRLGPGVSAGAALPHVDDARDVRAGRVHPRARVGVRVDVRGPDRPVHARRVGRVQRGRAVEPEQPGRRSTRSPREPDVRAVAPLAHDERADHAAPGLTQSREWTATGYDSRFVDHGAPKLDDNGALSDRRRRVPRGARVTQPRDRRVVVPGLRTVRRSDVVEDRRPVHRAGRGQRSRRVRSRSRRSAHRRGEQRRAPRRRPPRTICSACGRSTNRAYLDVRDPERVRDRVRRSLPRQRRQGRDAARQSCRTTWRSSSSSSC